MEKKQWVQHASRQGQKWEVVGEDSYVWTVPFHEKPQPYYLHLPKEEFYPCPPPEQWVDVTEECEVDECKISGWNNITHNGEETYQAPYRRRKVHLFEEVKEQWDFAGGKRFTQKPRAAFIIEKKVVAL